MPQIDPEMTECVEDCLRCHAVCLSTAMQHCLEAGGRHVEREHFSLMIACSEICATAARFMLIGTELHRAICRECAAICERCAEDCEKLGDMPDCVEACRSCAESCRAMAA